MIRLVLILAALFLPQWTVPQHVPAANPPSCSLPFSDTFTRANGPLGAAYSVTPSGSIFIASDLATAATFSAAPQIAFPVGCTWTTAQYAEVVVTAGDVSSHFGVTLNTVDGSNAYFIDCTLTNDCVFENIVAGTITFVGAFDPVPAAGSTVCLERSASNVVKLKYNGTYDTLTYTATGVSGAGGGGLWLGNQSSPANTISSFQAGNGVCP